MSENLKNLLANLSNAPASKQESPAHLPQSGGFLKREQIISTKKVPSPEPAASEESAKTEEPKPVERTQKVENKRAARSVDVKAEVKKVMRQDVSPDKYGVEPVQRNIRYYNEDVVEWLGKFSTKNQFRGGIAFNQSAVIENILQVMIYDLDLQPIGFKSGEELRQHILQKLKDY